MSWYKIALYKEAKVGKEWLENLKVPEENIPSFMEFFQGIPENIGPVLVNKFIKNTPQVPLEEVKRQYRENFEKETQFSKLAPEIQERVKQTSQDKDEREWVARILNEGSQLPEDLPIMQRRLEELARFGDKKITEFSSYSELDKYLSQFRQEQSAKAKEDLPEGSYITKADSNGVQLLYIDTDDPKGQQAIDALGAGASWCVLSPERAKHHPNRYHLFMVDGKAEVLVHPESDQIKDPQDESLTDGSIIKRIDPFVKQFNLNTHRGDFKDYNETVRKIKEVNERIDDNEFIKEKLDEDAGTFMILPEEKWGKYVHLLEKIYSPTLISELNYKALDYYAKHLKISKKDDKFESLVDAIISRYLTPYNDTPNHFGNLTVGRYNKVIPKILHTPKANQAFHDGREKIIQAWIEVAVSESEKRYEQRNDIFNFDKIYRCQINEVFEELEKNRPDVFESLVAHTKMELVNFGGLNKYNKLPKYIQENPDIRETAASVHAGRTRSSHTYYDERLPAALRDEPEVLDAREMAWLRHLETLTEEDFGHDAHNPENPFEKIPEDLKDNENVKKAIFYGIIDFCISYAEFAERVLPKTIPEELKGNSKVEEARVKGWINLFQDEEHNLIKYFAEGSGDHIPPDIQENQEFQEGVLEAWEDAIKTTYGKDEDNLEEIYGICPIKDHPKIQDARQEFWEDLIVSKGVEYFLHASEELKEEDWLINLCVRELLEMLEYDPYAYTTVNDQVKNFPSILRYTIEGVAEKVYDAEIDLEDVPENIRNHPSVIKAVENMKKDSRRPRLFSSVFNDNYIGKLS
jgi:hypothetical protein